MRTLASIDVGSNTVKLLVARVGQEGILEEVVREKETVRLGHETFTTGKLSPEAIEAGASALERLARIARASGAEEIRAVATCAVREAGNAAELAAEARRRSGLELEVISGQEEARLIMLAARSEFPSSCDPLFLIDIGGGSTELVVFEGDRVLFAESLDLGAVRLSERFIREDPVSRRDWGELKSAVSRRIRKTARKVRRAGFKTCVGTSGTVQSLSMVYEAAIRGLELFPSGHRTLPVGGLKKVMRLMRKTTLKEKLKIPGLDPKRRDISSAGAALLYRILKEVRAGEVVTGERGLREGILLDALARSGHATATPIAGDIREKNVERLAKRCNVDMPHAAHVARLADELFESSHALHQMTATEREWLRFSAILHDAGSYIGAKRHHRHSYYLITHGELAGFSADEIATIAAIARYHRGGRPRMRHPEWSKFDPWRRQAVEKLAAILRIADGLDRGHRQIVTGLTCRIRQKKVHLEISGPPGVEEEVESALRKSRLFARVFGRRPVISAAPPREAARPMRVKGSIA